MGRSLDSKTSTHDTVNLRPVVEEFTFTLDETKGSVSLINLGFPYIPVYSRSPVRREFTPFSLSTDGRLDTLHTSRFFCSHTLESVGGGTGPVNKSVKQGLVDGVGNISPGILNTMFLVTCRSVIKYNKITFNNH